MPAKRKQVVRKRVLKNDVYLRAAMNVHELQSSRGPLIFSCNQIDLVKHQYNSADRHRYEQLFKPDYAWSSLWLDHSDLPRKDRNEWRIMALLFMHAMVNNP